MSKTIVPAEAPMIYQTLEEDPELLEIALAMYAKFNVTELETINLVALARLGNKQVLDEALSHLELRVRVSK
jgi:hypothetical protein